MIEFTLKEPLPVGNHLDLHAPNGEIVACVLPVSGREWMVRQLLESFDEIEDLRQQLDDALVRVQEAEDAAETAKEKQYEAEQSFAGLAKDLEDAARQVRELTARLDARKAMEH